MQKPASLYIVSTPIGNLGDITLRAIDTLKTVFIIAAEDTRHSQHLLNHYGIATKTISLHEYNEKDRSELLIQYLNQGHSIAVISDAGTPLISDPGFYLVNAVRAAGFDVVAIPGASALLSALVASGLPTDRFIFEGFLPPKGEVRLKRLRALKSESRTIILYESPHRLLKLLDSLSEIFGDKREAVIARELTKKFETIRLGNLSELKKWINENPLQQKGEFVILLKGCEPTEKESEFDLKNLLQILLTELSLKQAVGLALKITQKSRKEIYNLALKLKKEEGENNDMEN